MKEYDFRYNLDGKLCSIFSFDLQLGYSNLYFVNKNHRFNLALQGTILSLINYDYKYGSSFNKNFLKYDLEHLNNKDIILGNLKVYLNFYDKNQDIITD